MGRALIVESGADLPSADRESAVADCGAKLALPRRSVLEERMQPGSGMMLPRASRRWNLAARKEGSCGDYGCHSQSVCSSRSRPAARSGRKDALAPEP